jgi:hypothetical protein
MVFAPAQDAATWCAAGHRRPTVLGARFTMEVHMKTWASRTLSVLVYLWTIPSVLFLLFVSLLIMREPGFPLILGLVETKGLMGLWATLIPGMVGLAAMILLLRHRPVGAKLLILYCLFWLISLGGECLVDWAQRQMTFSGWLHDDALVFVLLAPFLLSALWAWRRGVSASQAI